MKEKRNIKNSVLYVILTLVFLHSPLFGQAPDTVWMKTYGGTNYDRCFSVQQTTDGGYILGAMTMSYGAGDIDFWLIKTNTFGDTLWTKTYGGDTTDEAMSVQQTTDGGYFVAGRSKSFGPGFIQIYFIKTDSLGDSIWAKTLDANSVCYDARQTADTGYIIAGSIFGATEDIYLIKTNSLGDTLWSKIYGGGGADLCWSVRQTTDGGYILVGITGSFGAGSSDIWLLKTDENGDTLWTKTYGGTSWDYGISVDQTDDGGYIVTGRTNSFCVGYSDIWLLRTDANGDTLWAKTYGEAGCEGGRYVQQTSDGGFIVVAFTDSYGAGDENAWILKTDSNGDTLWTVLYGGPEWDHLFAGQQTSDEGYVFAGHTTSWGSGVSDVWLVKTEPDTFSIKERSIIVKDQVYKGPTVISGPILQPDGKNCKIFDITGRVVVPDKIKPGIYFVEIDGKITRKIIKIR